MLLPIDASDATLALNSTLNLGAALAALVAVAGLRLAGIRLGAQSALPFGPFLI